MTSIRPLSAAKDPLGFIVDGPCTFTPAQANIVFSRCRYENNRSEARSKAHIDALARQMAEGDWLPRSPIDFARLPDGRLVLVNGHHRMLAQVAAGRDILWQVVIHDVQDDDEVANLFWRYDTTIRKRSINNILAGVQASDNLGLSSWATTSLAKAVAFIDSGMRPVQGTYAKTLTPPERLRLMSEWQGEAKLYDDCVSLAITSVKRKMYGVQVMGVALITLRGNPDSAIRFWSGMAADDGLKKGDPRKTLLDHLRDTHASSTGMTGMAVACARSWNAWENDRELSMVRVGRQGVRIAGTNVVVQP